MTYLQLTSSRGVDYKQSSQLDFGHQFVFKFVAYDNAAVYGAALQLAIDMQSQQNVLIVIVDF